MEQMSNENKIYNAALKRLARWERKQDNVFSIFYQHSIQGGLMIATSGLCVYIPSIFLTIEAAEILKQRLDVLPLEKSMVSVIIITFLVMWIALAIVMCRSGLRQIAEDEKANKRLKGKKKRDEEYFSSRRFDFWLYAMSDFVIIAVSVLLILMG